MSSPVARVSDVGSAQRSALRQDDPAADHAALGLDGLHDGGHGADQPPESLDGLGFAGDVDLGV